MQAIRFALIAIAALGMTAAVSVGAQDKGAPKAAVKMIVENAKVAATETTYAPGAESSTSRAEIRVVRALSGGTLQRTYADGKKEQIVYKTGDVRINEPGPAYTTKNIGKTEVKLYVVRLK
jgi:hypothetical protein